MSEVQGQQQSDTVLTFAEFLESTPPTHPTDVTGLWHRIPGQTGYQSERLSTPQIFIHCTSDECNGLRYFRYAGDQISFHNKKEISEFLTYICSNCRKTSKLYSIRARKSGAFLPSEDIQPGQVTKYGELPAFGPPTSPRLLRLFGDERENFLKGRRCETQGLGIGAFSYYRRVVENQKDRIFSEIIRVAEKIGASSSMISTLKAAKAEIQFSKALQSTKDAMPQAFLINGHNPLTLLHSALSDGLHQRSDDECLEFAQDIRVVLAELADRLGQLLKDEAEINTAVSRLMGNKRKK